MEETYNQKTLLDVPYREHAIIITKEGYFPNRLVVFKNEKVHFFVTAVGEKSACFNLPSKNIYSHAVEGKVIETETFFDKTGTFLFDCPNHKMNGRIIVLEKSADKEESLRRGLASDVVKVWQPKEVPSEWVQIKKDELQKLRGMGDVMDLDEKP